MKKYLLVLTSSLFSAFLAIVLYRQFIETPQTIIVRDVVAPKLSGTPTDRPDVFDIGSSPKAPLREPANFAEAAKLVTPAVVNIKTIQSSGSFNFLRGGGVGTASGSGVILSPSGYIVTNKHVIKDGGEIRVTLTDKREFEAALIGTDPSTDLALIKVEGSGLPALSFGNSDSTQIGEWVLAVGNPFNLSSTVTAGIVSAKGRKIDILDVQDRIESFIQTDAAVNPGNSGGALVNSRGELIGINTAIITRSGRYEGYSFAVPANLASKVVKDLRDYGMVQRGLMGVYIDDVDSRRARELGLSEVVGVYITRVTKGGAADAAGLKKGDVIIAVNGVTTETLPEMQEQVGRYRPGNTIAVEFIRKGERRKASVVLRNKRNTTDLVSAEHREYLQDVGFALRELSEAEKSTTGLSGIWVEQIFSGTPIERTNMDEGFIITAINEQPISNIDQLVGSLKSIKGDIMIEGYYPNDNDRYFYTFAFDEQ
ncbi:MAG: trypsin-like peptidase domain-containing protein [Saprospiraceae bacterium]|nr:trypsin-like peptidase domain-containing protein [Saprospiraceae bacterium]